MKGRGQENIDVPSLVERHIGKMWVFLGLNSLHTLTPVSLSRPHVSLPEHQKKVLQGLAGEHKGKGGIKSFKDRL